MHLVEVDLQGLDARRALADLERDHAIGNGRLEFFNARAKAIICNQTGESERASNPLRGAFRARLTCRFGGILNWCRKGSLIALTRPNSMVQCETANRAGWRADTRDGVNFTHAAPYNGEAFLRPTLERRHFSCHTDLWGVIRAGFLERRMSPSLVTYGEVGILPACTRAPTLSPRGEFAPLTGIYECWRNRLAISNHSWGAIMGIARAVCLRRRRRRIEDNECLACNSHLQP